METENLEAKNHPGIMRAKNIKLPQDFILAVEKILQSKKYIAS